MAYEDEAAVLMATVPKMLQELTEISTRAASLFYGLVDSKQTETLPTEFFKIKKAEKDDSSTTNDVEDTQDSMMVENNLRDGDEESVTTPTIEISTTIASTTPPGISGLKIDSPSNLERKI